MDIGERSPYRPPGPARSTLLKEALQQTRAYRFAGMIYHDYVLGTLTRIKYTRRYNARRNHDGTPRRTILFHPEKPGHSEVLYKICKTLGYSITDSPAQVPDLVVAYEDVTNRAHNELLAGFAVDRPVVNIRCDDISKVRVETVFQEVFDYGTFVDPIAHRGPCVVKSNANAMHDGRTVDCPVATIRRGAVYQRLINNVLDHQAVDIRVPVVGTDVPFVYRKYRSLRSRFSNTNTSVEIDSADSAFSAEEMRKIQEFVQRLGLDYGELDVLRDVDDGRIYIVDVNNTPCGPPNHLDKADVERAIEMLSESFETQFMARRAPVSAAAREERQPDGEVLPTTGAELVLAAEGVETSDGLSEPSISDERL
ncbi:hypothetical protein [Mycobacterium sp. NAZ190054]|uniref:hypothetical protein n=1 Tax=Mycobacterium sp. NAZ190054 TaxID=1747766 RepID=UPI000796A39F|nr:hypothetical protein [Mycobacterium sp. NAZ190054]KWX56724.1 hypothetical protein ASJ79_02110 [Mycobacterium sp. NAZ190054]